jgi:hypothetical protein
MKLFSKRNVLRDLNSIEARTLSPSIRTGRRAELIGFEARNRLIAEIKFLSSRDDFLEWFIFFENKKKETIFFDRDKIDSFSLAELGYAMSDYFEFEYFKMVQIERKIRYPSEEEKSDMYFDDYKLFDLAEITILFSKPEQRAEVIKRFNIIFDEENTNYEIVQHLITRKSGESLKTLKNILKDDSLKNKLNSYLNYEAEADFVNAAKVSAEIVNILFSGYIKNDKPNIIKDLKQKLLNNLLSPSDAKSEKGKRFDQHLDLLLKISKDLSNDIYDVRHTEKSTIEIKNDNIYKLIARNNGAIIELVLTSLKDDYVLSDDWEKIKQDYINKYKIDPNSRLTIKKPDPVKDIDISDIPF